MADNQRQIQATVDIDVEPSLKALRELKKQLKETAAGTDEFRKLQEQINDTEDAIRSARAGADNFAEILGTLPGPIGSIGSQIGGTVANLKQFSAIKFTNIKASIADFGKDIIDVGKGIGSLTGITKVYTVTNNFLANSFKAVGASEAVASAGARGFAAALTATGIGALVVLLGTLVANFDKVGAALMKMIPGLKEVGKWVGNLYDKFTDFLGLTSQDERNLDKQIKNTNRRKEDLEARIAILEAEGGKEKEVYNLKKQIKQEELNDLRNTLKVKGELSEEEAKQFRAAKNAIAVLDAAERKRLQDIKDNADKAAAATAQKNKDAKDAKDKKDKDDKDAKDKKDAEDKIKAIEEAGKAELDAYLEGLSEREQEEYQAGVKLNERLAAINKAGVGDRQAIQEAYRKQIIAINKKYDDQEAKDTEEKNKKDLEDKLKKLAQDKGDYDSKYARLVSGAANDLDLQRQLLEAKKLNDQKYYADVLANENLTAEQIREINDRKLSDQIFYTEKSNQIEKDRIAVKQKALDDILSIAGAESDVGKAVLVAKQILAAKELILEVQRTITFSAQAAARSTVAVAEGTAQTAKIGFPQNIPMLIGYAAQAFGIISAIRSAVSAAKASTAISGGGGSISSGATAFSSVPQITAPQIQGGVGAQNPTAQIAQTIAQSSGKPVRAYVVSQDISSQQAMDRRTNVAATL